MGSCLRFDIAELSDIGEREENQDCVRVVSMEDEEAMLLCDGMGGFAGGRIASELCVNEMERLLTKTPHANLREFFEYAMDVIDLKIRGLRDEEGRPYQAGSTLITALIREDCLHWLSIGDSRMYVLREGRLSQMTRDHTVELDAKIRYSRGELSIAEYDAQMAQKSTLCSYMGRGGISLYDINPSPLALCPGDIVLLATDGLYKALSPQEIEEVIEKDRSHGAAYVAGDLIRCALTSAYGCHADNTSVVVCIVS